ncbi:MAG: N-acetylmuramidase family protein, partial [Rhodocyclaceae bacterium]|nr:N-acetylmuramidase family protein [Rhodocyclaceae bacterium]
MRKGDTGASVRELQHRLAAAGFEVEKDGWFGDKTEAAVVAFQQRTGLVADGIAGPKTMAVLETGRRPARLLGQADIEKAAEDLGVAVAAVMAVNEVESLGRGFLPDGRPVILFERHVMHRLLAEAGYDADATAARFPNVVH